MVKDGLDDLSFRPNMNAGITVRGDIVNIWYTKDSDTPGSGEWTPSGVPTHHYSTDEQVVGTWIDGSTVYEKTFDVVLNANSFTIDTSALNIGKVVNVNGQLTKDNGVSLNYPYYDSSSWYSVFSYNPAPNNTIIIASTSNIVTNYPNLILTVQYTKSTT